MWDLLEACYHTSCILFVAWWWYFDDKYKSLCLNFPKCPPDADKAMSDGCLNLGIGAWRAKREIVSFRVVRACARCLCEVRSG